MASGRYLSQQEQQSAGHPAASRKSVADIIVSTDPADGVVQGLVAISINHIMEEECSMFGPHLTLLVHCQLWT